MKDKNSHKILQWNIMKHTVLLLPHRSRGCKHRIMKIACSTPASLCSSDLTFQLFCNLQLVFSTWEDFTPLFLVQLVSLLYLHTQAPNSKPFLSLIPAFPLKASTQPQAITLQAHQAISSLLPRLHRNRSYRNPEREWGKKQISHDTVEKTICIYNLGLPGEQQDKSNRHV